MVVGRQVAHLQWGVLALDFPMQVESAAVLLLLSLVLLVPFHLGIVF